MKRIIAVVLLSLSLPALAACPSWAPYGCTLLPSGKQLCGCGR